MCAATEAMIELLALADRKRRRFFVMKGTAGHVIGASLFQRNVTLDHVHDVEAIEQILNEAFWNHPAPLPLGMFLLRQSVVSLSNRPFAVSLSNHKAANPAFYDKRAFTSAETLPMSARPASLGLSKAITLPISCGDFAPLATMASATAADTSSSLSGCGI